MNCTKNELLIMRTLRWSQTIEISVEPNSNRGKRATLISNSRPDQPTLLRRNLLIPSCALQEPSVEELFSSSISTLFVSLLRQIMHNYWFGDQLKAVRLSSFIRNIAILPQLNIYISIVKGKQPLNKFYWCFFCANENISIVSCTFSFNIDSMDSFFLKLDRLFPVINFLKTIQWKQDLTWREIIGSLNHMSLVEVKFYQHGDKNQKD